MAEVFTTANDARKGAAADWLARLSGPGVDASPMSDELAADFDVWVSEPANGAAYDAALSVLLEIEAAAPQVLDGLSDAASQERPSRLAFRRAWMTIGGLAAAAAVAVAITPLSVFVPETLTFATAKGEHRQIRLADGSTVELNGGSKLTVTMARNERRLTLPEGEALFDVAPDKARPFLIAAGDRTVRVVGTRFDVRHLGGQLSVTVERGVVEVRPSDGANGRTWRLHPGQRLDTAAIATPGVAPTVQLSEADPVSVESWRSGRLIYRDRPLGDVVADLNQQFAKPIVLEDPALASLHVSGVLVLDTEEAVTRRLALLAPVKALTSEKGVLLRRDPVSKP